MTVTYKDGTSFSSSELYGGDPGSCHGFGITQNPAPKAVSKLVWHACDYDSYGAITYSCATPQYANNPYS